MAADFAGLKRLLEWREDCAKPSRAGAVEAMMGGGMYRELLVDGSCSLEEVVAKVEYSFADMLADGPLATTPRERRRLLRHANRALVDQYRTFFPRPWARALGDIADVVLPFSCECAEAACEAQVPLAVSAFPAPPDDTSPPVLTPGHQGLGPGGHARDSLRSRGASRGVAPKVSRGDNGW
ncbi:hypothetical protein [Streptomyces sp. 2A115]|uniref:hypothetical protein n=1 Tax=Streptomyces sp. 2A115 TaxID=3457439 RepID=UPI003FD5BA70